MSMVPMNQQVPVYGHDLDDGLVLVGDPLVADLIIRNLGAQRHVFRALMLGPGQAWGCQDAEPNEYSRWYDLLD
jgi:hypothetical protein